nr:MAG: RNA-dependent RNA polymerase [Chemarfal virus 121]
MVMESIQSGVPYCLALGDDTIHLAPRALNPAAIETYYKELGWDANESKQDQSEGAYYVLQQRYHPELGRHPNGNIKSTQPFFRAMVGIFFQERANEFASAQASLNTMMKLNNLAYHPLVEEVVEFVIKGDKLYALGMKIGGIKSLFKVAMKETNANGQNLGETLDLA